MPDVSSNSQLTPASRYHVSLAVDDSGPLFSLTPTDRRRAGPAAERLLEHPRALLVAVLVGNLVINLLFFAFAARLQPL